MLLLLLMLLLLKRKSNRGVCLQQLLKPEDLVGIQAFQTGEQAGQQRGNVARFVPVGVVIVGMITIIIHCSVDEIFGENVGVDGVVGVIGGDQS